MGVRVPWSEEEALILVDAFFQQKEGKIQKKDAVANVSKELRDRAKRLGNDIDEMYRNENGIAMQMGTLEHIYTDGQHGLRSGSKLFIEIMRLHKNENQVFQKRLMEARTLEMNKNNEICDVLKKHFTYGIRYDSPIELMRLKRFYAEDYGEECQCSDEEIKNDILQSCLIHEGKGYVLLVESQVAIKAALNELLGSGNIIVYYAEIFEKSEEWFLSLGIFSDEMLKSFISRCLPDVFCKKAYFSKHKGTENELLRLNAIEVWGDEILNDYSSLKMKMEYVPIEKVKYVLANNACFVWNSPETYTVESKFEISETERLHILEKVKEKVDKEGSVSMDEIVPESIFDENYELSETAIYTLVYDQILKGEYDRYNKIISLKGQENDATKLISDYCLSKREISLDELFEQYENRTGTHRQAEPLEIAYSTMIRTEVDKFVCDELVDFRAAEIDKVLDTLVLGDALGLKSITSFAPFPDCNYPWNLFLIESFCRRFSNTFKFMVGTTNSRNAGAIVRRECHDDYHTIMARQLVNNHVEFDEDIAMDYLYDNGFIARHSYKYIKELVDLARELSEGR